MARNFIYKIENNYITITHVNKKTRILKIPATIKKCPIIKILDGAFLSCKLLKEIRVTKRNLKYTSLNGVLFSKDCSTLIKFPSKLNIDTYKLPTKTTKIHDGAFENSISLKEIIFNKRLKYIGNFSFFNCNNISSIICNKNLKIIGNGAFMSCKKLNDVQLNDRLNTICSGAFFKCNISKLQLPQSVRVVGEGAFLKNNNLQEISCFQIPFSKNYLYDNYIVSPSINYILIKQIDENTTSYEIDNEWTTNILCTSSKKTNVKEIYINNLQKIENKQFYNFKTVESFYIGKTISYIGDKAFTKCINLKRIIVSPENEYFSDIDGVLCDKNKTRIICYPANKQTDTETYTVPDSIITLDKLSFSFSRKLKSINLNNVITINHGAFEYSNIKDIIFTNKQKIIDNFAFSGCIFLKNINFNTSKIKRIGSACFKNCISLIDVNLKTDHIPEVGENVFEKCSDLLHWRIENY